VPNGISGIPNETNSAPDGTNGTPVTTHRMPFMTTRIPFATAQTSNSPNAAPDLGDETTVTKNLKLLADFVADVAIVGMI
jgi:hypothetical protein